MNMPPKKRYKLIQPTSWNIGQIVGDRGATSARINLEFSKVASLVKIPNVLLNLITTYVPGSIVPWRFLGKLYHKYPQVDVKIKINSQLKIVIAIRSDQYFLGAPASVDCFFVSHRMLYNEIIQLINDHCTLATKYPSTPCYCAFHSRCSDNLSLYQNIHCLQSFNERQLLPKDLNSIGSTVSHWYESDKNAEWAKVLSCPNGYNPWDDKNGDMFDDLQRETRNRLAFVIPEDLRHVALWLNYFSAEQVSILCRNGDGDASIEF